MLGLSGAAGLAMALRYDIAFVERGDGQQAVEAVERLGGEPGTAREGGVTRAEELLTPLEGAHGAQFAQRGSHLVDLSGGQDVSYVGQRYAQLVERSEDVVIIIAPTGRGEAVQNR